MVQSNKLPPKYYHTYHQYILKYVKKHYKTHLTKKEKKFIQTLQKTDEDSQCLYLRMAGRRSIFFKESQLQYDEIKDIPNCLKTLQEAKLVEPLQEIHKPYYAEFLNTISKKELHEASQKLSQEKLKKTINKPNLIAKIVESIPFQKITKYFNQKEKIWVQLEWEMEQKMRFLFFGHLYGSITDFVVRDIGHQQYEVNDGQEFTPYFTTRQEIDECYELSRLSQQLYLLEKTTETETTFIWFQQWFEEQEYETEKAQVKIDKMLIRLGKYFEKNKKAIYACQAYKHTQRPPSRERRVRLYKKAEDNGKALQLCEEILQNPQNNKEKIFAQDFKNRLIKGTKRTIKSTSQKLKEAEILPLDKKWKYNVEEGVLQYYKKKGYSGIFSENHLWRGLFGVVFWELLYDLNASALHHPLQKLPSDLYQSNFYEKRKEAIHAHLNLLANPAEFQIDLKSLFIEKQGTQNALVLWNDEMLAALQFLTQQLKPHQLQPILLKMCQNFKENATGFPDLFIYKKRAYHFIEVKSPTDTLSAQQLHHLTLLEIHQIKAKIIRIVWK